MSVGEFVADGRVVAVSVFVFVGIGAFVVTVTAAVARLVAVGKGVSGISVGIGRSVGGMGDGVRLGACVLSYSTVILSALIVVATAGN